MTNTTYPAPLASMIRDIASEGYAPRDIRQTAEFLRGATLRDITPCTLTLRNKVVAMLANNDAPRSDRHPICSDCWHVAFRPVTLTDADGATRVVCERHTLTLDELLARLDAIR